MSNRLTQALAAFATGTIAPPAAARRITALSALDWLAVGRAGVGEPVATVTRQITLNEGGSAEAHLFGSKTRVPARAAALANGTASHALDFDDTHFDHIGHPSVAVFPAALAMGERQGAAVVDVLEAALLGMELSIRVGLWLGRGHYQVGFHQTATAGAFGAAAAAGRILGLDAGQMAHVLGLTATRASGLKAQFGTMGKPYNAGLAAAGGAEAALLVAAGFQANPDALEGAFGFGATHHGAGAVDAALEGLGTDWRFEGVSHKFHACCHGLHAALEASRDLDIAAPEVSEMTVRTHPSWMNVCNQTAPETGLGAKFSFTTVLAMRALGHDTGLPDSFSDALCADPRLAQLRRRISVVADDSLSETEAVLTVLRRDGAKLEARHDLAAPLPIDEREERVRAKAAKLIGLANADAVWGLLQRGGSAAGLGAMLSG